MTRSDYLARIQSEKRAGIIAATIDLFVNQPYAGTSMDTIAAAANVSKRTLYNHFPSKEELFIAAIESLQDSFASEEIRPSRMVKGSDVPEAILIAAVQQTLEIIMTPVAVGLLRLVITENLRAPELGRVYLERGKKRVLGQIIEIIQALSGKNALEVEDSRAAAEQLMGMVKEAIYWPILTGLPIPAPRERNRVIRDAVITFYARYGER